MPVASPPTMSPATKEVCIAAAASPHSTSPSQRRASAPVTISSAWNSGSHSTSTDRGGSSSALCSRSAYARASSSATPTKTEKVRPDTTSALWTARLIRSSSARVNKSPAGTGAPRRPISVRRALGLRRPVSVLWPHPVQLRSSLDLAPGLSATDPDRVGHRRRLTTTGLHRVPDLGDTGHDEENQQRGPDQQP